MTDGGGAGHRGDLERETWDVLRGLVHDADAKREVCEALGLSFARIRALRRIAPAPIAMRDLVAALNTDPPYLTLVVDDLEARGFVVRSPHPDDRRAKIVSATASGRQAARRAEAILAQPPAAIRGLSDTELVQLNQLLSRSTAPQSIDADR
jgi:DNA-binding MarR family transcriptional regulator